MKLMKSMACSLALLAAVNVPVVLAFDNNAGATPGMATPQNQQDVAGQKTGCAQCHRHHHNGGAFFQDLNLTESQKTQVQALMAEKRQQFQQNRQEFMSILTPEQKAKMEAMRGDREGGGPRGPHGQFFSQLNLTPEQKSQLEAQRAAHKQEWESFHQKMLAILTPEQREKFNAKMQEKREHWQQKRGGMGQPGSMQPTSPENTAPGQDG